MLIILGLPTFLLISYICFSNQFFHSTITQSRQKETLEATTPGPCTIAIRSDRNKWYAGLDIGFDLDRVVLDFDGTGLDLSQLIIDKDVFEIESDGQQLTLIKPFWLSKSDPGHIGLRGDNVAALTTFVTPTCTDVIDVIDATSTDGACPDLLGCYIENTDHGKRVDLSEQGVNRYGITATPLTMTCETSNDLTFLQFIRDDGERTKERSSPYHIAGDSAGIVNPSAYLSTAGDKQITVVGDVEGSTCFEKTYDLEAFVEPCTVNVRNGGNHWHSGLDIGFNVEMVVLDFSRTGLDIDAVRLDTGVFKSVITGPFITITKPSWVSNDKTGYMGFNGDNVPELSSYSPPTCFTL